MIVSFGEMLWDLLPSGKVPGGAPMNVAFHACQLGLPAVLISKVGKDPLGEALLEFLSTKNVPPSLVQRDPHYPTGTVRVELDEAGSPRYEIVAPVAWDFINLEEEAMLVVRDAEAFLYGSLASRLGHTKKTLLAFLDAARKRVFDINLRVPFYSKELILELLAKADVLKMNEEEMIVLAQWLGKSLRQRVGNEEISERENRDRSLRLRSETDMMDGDNEFDSSLRLRSGKVIHEGELAFLTWLKEKYHLELIIVTKGKDGAVCLDASGYFQHPGYVVNVVDTVGSGDSFLAAFCQRYFSGHPVSECLSFAAAVGAIVATKRGATPEVTMAEVMRLRGG